MPAPKKSTTNGAMTPAQKARQKASGRAETDIYKKKMFGKPEVSEKAKALRAAGKVEGLVNNNMTGKPSKFVTRQVPSDAYDTLGRLADAQNLKGQAREKAINSAFKVVSSRMQSDRNRTASRVEASAKRNAKGTKNVSNTQKLIGG
jgi:hypothetical protein